MRTRNWIILIAALALVLGVLSYLTLTRRSEGRVAEVVRDGEVLYEIDLDRVTEESQFTVEYPGGGSNTILVRPGRIRVLEADCPDKICVDQGWLSDQAAPIVCLPHHLVIRLAGEQVTDAVAR